jgi:hypothetical protein
LPQSLPYPLLVQTSFIIDFEPFRGSSASSLIVGTISSVENAPIDSRSKDALLMPAHDELESARMRKSHFMVPKLDYKRRYASKAQHFLL